MSTNISIPFWVQAISAYTARDSAELSLEFGKVYEVFQVDAQGQWWQSHGVDGRLGWLPACYTKRISNPAPPVAPSLSSQASTRTFSSPGPSSPLIGAKAPMPSRPPTVEKNPTPVYVTLHVVEARGLLVDYSKSELTAFIFRRNITCSSSPRDEIHKTVTIKKNAQPKWNEQFQCNVFDPEVEVLSVRVCNSRKFKAKAPEFLGEANVPLRQAVRDFDFPSSQLRWYPLQTGNGSSNCGEVLLYIQFTDSRQCQGPSNVQHTSHIGWNADGSYDINNIPKEWKKFFKEIGLKKSALKKDPQLAQEIFQVMSENFYEIPAGVDLSKNSYYETQQAPPPPPPPASASVAATTTSCSNIATATTALPPPPPPHRSSSSPAIHSINMPSPPPAPPRHQTNVVQGSSPLRAFSSPPPNFGDLMENIRAGTVLRPAKPASRPLNPPALSTRNTNNADGGSSSLSDALINVMIAIRRDIAPTSESDDSQEEWN